MNKIIRKEDDLLSIIKDIILKYFIVKEDRLDIMSDRGAPELRIDIDLSYKNSNIIIMVGTHNYKQSIPEHISSDYLINFFEIKEIIDFVLRDEHIISEIYIGKDSFELTFQINWSDKAISGLYCSDIELNLNFNNINLRNEYINKLIENYYDILINVPSFNKIKDEYLNKEKERYVDSIDKEKMMNILNKMDERELKSLLYGLDNDVFFKYICDNETDCKRLE